MAPRKGPSGVEKIDVASYVVWRRIERDGAYHYRQVVCVNPVVGSLRLDEWEAELRTQAPVAPAPAAAAAQA